MQAGFRKMCSALLLSALMGCSWMQGMQKPATAPPQAAAGAPGSLDMPAVAGQREPDGPLIDVQASGEENDAAAGRAIANKLRLNLRLPKGKFPANAEVVLEGMLSPGGAVLGARVARSSGYKALDEAVLKALARAQPLPVPRSVREAEASQRLYLKFRPMQKPA